MRLAHLAHLVEELWVSGATDEKVELFHTRLPPRVDDVDRHEDRTDRVGEPECRRELSHHRGDESAQVGEDVVEVVAAVARE